MGYKVIVSILNIRQLLGPQTGGWLTDVIEITFLFINIVWSNFTSKLIVIQ